MRLRTSREGEFGPSFRKPTLQPQPDSNPCLHLPTSDAHGRLEVFPHAGVNFHPEDNIP